MSPLKSVSFRQRDNEQLSYFQFAEVNCMALTEPQQVYVELWAALSEQVPLPIEHAVCVNQR